MLVTSIFSFSHNVFLPKQISDSHLFTEPQKKRRTKKYNFQFFLYLYNEIIYMFNDNVYFVICKSFR